MIAINSIHLKPGFKAYSGSYFHGYLANTGCPPVVVNPVLAIKEIGKEQGDLLIYPNPTTGNLNIVLSESNIDSPVEVSLFNLTGKEIYNSRFTRSSIFTLDLGRYNKGMYIIRLQNGDQIYFKKIIKH